jgi:predicted nucleic acid-binding protein
MILVDSSVWIDHFQGRRSTQVLLLEKLLDEGGLGIFVADLVYLELLRGASSKREERMLEELLGELLHVEIAGFEACRSAAHKYIKLRQSGFTVSKTPDLPIASWCIDEGVALLHDDKDFEPFKKLGLKMA